MNYMGRIFGTDGARGIAGSELTVELALNIGRAAAMVLADETHHRPLVVIGCDTRISGSMLESSVAAGLCSVGADVILLGVVPTPAVAYLTEELKADAGVMISASHNPYEFNGIKLFGPSGFKLSDEEEAKIEAIILDNAEPYNIRKGSELGKITVNYEYADRYVQHLVKKSTGNYKGKILVDCANGSASATAEKLCNALQLDADIINSSPNGININDNCGSTHIDLLAEKVLAKGYDVGLAFDGDADRLLAVDEKGNILDGDFLLAILSEYFRSQNKLKNDSVVVTSMTNLGFLKLMKTRKINVETTAVGDRYVLEAMKEKGHSLGGEQSGHMIFLDHSTTGDGQLSAIMLLNAISYFNRPLSELASAMTRFPQVMINVPATPSMKAALPGNPVVNGDIKNHSEQLGDRGRIVVRASGTEPFIRVMIEGEQLLEIQKAADSIAMAIREHLI